MVAINSCDGRGSCWIHYRLPLDWEAAWSGNRFSVSDCRCGDGLGNFLRRIGRDGDLEVSSDLAVELDGDRKVPQALDRLVELNLAAIHFIALAASSLAMSAEVTEPNSWPFSPDLRVKLSETVSSLASSSCACTFSVAERRAAASFICSITALLASVACRASLRGRRIAAVAVRHLHDIAAVAEVGYVFFQNDFHVKFSRFTGRPDIVPSVRCVDTGGSHSVAPRQILSRFLRGRRLGNYLVTTTKAP